ncbi:outer membrane lipoprotein carrier protein LolA [uncultured Deefgea sp.]|uniref:outer membrane lipoprotein carrier protein LolA n=1 Tax=uncultured Deefgea sp. TaxID=1304914 RepID=UPI00259476FB|nr:outer membrane lipoprotein carrier protein LolA [uncultured Deefgea sp.]
MNLQSLALALLLIVAPAHSALLDDVKARVSVKDTLRGEFRQEKRIANLAKPLLASGQFVYLKQQGLLWQIEKPYASDSIITADTLIQSVNGKIIVRVDAKSQPAYSAVSRIFMALVAGDWAALEADFVITGYVDAQRWQLTLKPKAGLFASFAKTLTLTGASALQQIDIAEKNGDSTHYTLSQVRPAGALSAAEENQFLRQ